MNPNDEIRNAILRYLYEVHEKASSPKTAALKISQLQKAMKERAGYKRNVIGGNLDIMISTIPACLQFLKGGQLKALAVPSLQRRVAVWLAEEADVLLSGGAAAIC